MATPFAHAVASFDPTSDAVLLWTRLTGATSADWVLARDPGLRDVAASGTAVTGSQRDGTIVVDATGLEPATTYWYAFTAAGGQSPVGRTRTLPSGGVDELVLGLVSCADYSKAPLTVYRALAQREVDLVIHLGDYVYETDHSKRRQHDPPRELHDLDDYRRRYAQMRTDPDCQSMHLRHPMAAVVDDHDLADNAWRGGAKHHVEVDDGPWSARALAAMTARAEWVPSRRRNPDDVLVTWRSLQVGDLAELLLLDSRLCGRDLQAGEEGALPLMAQERTILGAEQTAWVQERVTDTTRPWCLVVNGVVVNELVLRRPLSRLPATLLPEGYAEHGDVLLRDDQWDGYPADRDRLVAALGRRRAAGGGALLLSGDVHSSWAFEGPRDPGGDPVAVEAVTPSVSSAPMGRTRLPVVWRLLDTAVRRLEHVRFVDVTNRGFVLVRVGRDRVVVGWHFVDPYDTADEPAVAADRWLEVRQGLPRWQESQAFALPERPGLPVALPSRPDDVVAARRAHQRRRAAGLAAFTTVVTGAAVAAARAVRRR